MHLGAEMVQCESAVFIGGTLKCLPSANLFWAVDYHVRALHAPFHAIVGLCGSPDALSKLMLLASSAP